MQWQNSGGSMKVADETDYDDYNEYAAYLSSWLEDRIDELGPGSYFVSSTLLYKWIQEFNRSLYES